MREPASIQSPSETDRQTVPVGDERDRRGKAGGQAHTQGQQEENRERRRVHTRTGQEGVSPRAAWSSFLPGKQSPPETLRSLTSSGSTQMLPLRRDGHHRRALSSWLQFGGRCRGHQRSCLELRREAWAAARLGRNAGGFGSSAMHSPHTHL